MNINNLLKISLAICLVLIGASFFYQHVIFNPKIEQRKLNEKKSLAIEASRSQAKALLLAYFSLSDTALSYQYGEITYGESRDKYKDLVKEVDILKNKTIEYQPSNDVPSDFSPELLKNIGFLKNYCELNVKYSEYVIDNGVLEQEIMTFRETANNYRSGYFANNETARKWDDAGDKRLEMYNQKKIMIEKVTEQASNEFNSIVGETWKLYNTYGALFKVDDTTVFSLTQNLNNQKKSKQRNSTPQEKQG